MTGKGKRRWRVAGSALALLVGLGGCLEANTLGDEPPDEVRVGSPPRWDNGMRELMQLKCGVCHQVPRPKRAPRTIPADLDLNLLTGTGGIRGARDALTAVQAQVLAGVMPLEFATPLTVLERQAILSWDGS